jgi:hypothetical protein
MAERVARCGYGAQYAVIVALAIFPAILLADEPPALNPFGPATSEQRDDAVQGCLELSDGSLHPGLITLTRDKRLKIYDNELQRQREVPLQAIKEIQCKVKKEWLEKEWKFKETTSDEKIFTGYSYPVREYLHSITLRDGRTITGPLAAIVYVEPPHNDSDKQQPVKFLLNKRNKGTRGQDLKSLIYVKRITLGKEAFEEGKKKQKAAEQKTSHEESTNYDRVPTLGVRLPARLLCTIDAERQARCVPTQSMGTRQIPNP